MLAELHKHLEETKLLPPKSKIVVAVSGGVDSVTLLHLLHNLRSLYGWNLIIAHYNHGVREDATKDALLVGQLAEDYGYQLFLGKYELTNFTEAALRKARYGFLEKIRRDSGADLIATAHHNNDFIETALFNTIRGADREGMVALKPRRGVIVRPLLPYSKAEIITFANLQNLPYREDSTNNDMSYSRNFVRNVLIPHGSIKFRNFHHNLNRRLARLEQLNRKINTGLDRLAQQIVSYEDSRSIELDRLQFTKMSFEVQQNMLVYLIKRLMPSHKLTKKLINKAVDFANNSKSGSRLMLPGSLQLINSYDKLIITSDLKEFSGPNETSLHVLSKTKPFKNELFILSITSKENSKIRLPLQKLYVRYRQPGDKVYPIGLNGSKKLQDVFVDAKIPRHLRSYWPIVVTASNEVVWVPNLVKDRRFVESESNKYQYLNCEVR